MLYTYDVSFMLMAESDGVVPASQFFLNMIMSAYMQACPIYIHILACREQQHFFHMLYYTSFGIIMQGLFEIINKY